MPKTYTPTARTTPTRSRGRASYDAALVHAVLDEALTCTVAFVVDGRPAALLTIHARVGETVYLHASTGAHLARLAGGADSGVDVCVTVTLLDGLVLARSAMHHSMNYRSVVAFGTARRVTDEAEARGALAAVVDHVVRGRSAECRPPDRKELAATTVLALDLGEVSVKVRTGGVSDDPEDLALPHWAGVVPLRTAAGDPLPEPDLAPDTPVPANVATYRR